LADLHPLPPDPAPITPGNLALRDELREFHSKLKALDAATEKTRPPKTLQSDFSIYRECLQKRVDILRLQASFDPNSTVVKSALNDWTGVFPEWLANFQRTRPIVESWLEKQRGKARTSDSFATVTEKVHAIFRQPHRAAVALVQLVHSDEELSTDDVFEELAEHHSGAFPSRYDDWPDYQRKKGKRAHDIIDQVRRVLKKHKLLRVSDATPRRTKTR